MTLSENLRSQLSLPVVAAPLFIISNPDLVVAQCTSGIVGSFRALNARLADMLDEWIARIETSLAGVRTGASTGESGAVRGQSDHPPIQ